MEAIDRGAQPVKQFLLRYAREKDLALFTAAGQIPRPNKPEDLPMRVVMPAYILSELKTGFAIGAVLFLPFLLIDMVTAAITTYMGDQNVNYLETPSGQKIQLNVPGSQVFLGSGSNSVFGALNSLVADYSSGTVDTAQAVSDTQALSAALNNVSQQRVTIDNSITQVTAASDAVTNVQTQLTTAQTNLMQADIPTISTQLSLSETQQTALEDVIAQLNSSSNDLFSKLPE
jgi:flagellin-like hook-associated protein FlgL